MRQKNETATSFKDLKEITQIMQALKPSAQTSENANTSEITSQSTPKPRRTARAKNSALKPTKRAFSERQRITIRDNSQASANSNRETKASHNANAFKTEQGLKSNLRAEPSDEAFKPGLKNNQSKGGNNEA
ncbi:hypothetical protein KVD04_01085 [Helicobacter pylori]|nr:hypothetical protein KVD04_01085 [Helicobacter pylori]